MNIYNHDCMATCCSQIRPFIMDRAVSSTAYCAPELTRFDTISTLERSAKWDALHWQILTFGPHSKQLRKTPDYPRVSQTQIFKHKEIQSCPIRFRRINSTPHSAITRHHLRHKTMFNTETHMYLDNLLQSSNSISNYVP